MTASFSPYLAPSEVWKLRADLKTAIREFYHERNYLEIDTPLAVACPGTEVHLDYFKTHWRDFRQNTHPLWLRSSPELHMKQALASGLEKIFQLATCFRNGGEYSPWHHPEFTMLEWYEAGASFEAFLDATEALLQFSWEKLRAGPRAPLITFSFPQAFTRLTVAEAFSQFASLKLEDQDPDLAKKARSQGVISVRSDDDFETAFFKILLEKVEPALAQLPAAILYDYPASQAALARIEGGVAKRFEFYIRGIELCNGFYELLDPRENRQRVAEAWQYRKALGKELPREDEDFYLALERGIPSCSGNALGFDRWLAILIGAQSLDAVIPFRHRYPYLTEHVPQG